MKLVRYLALGTVLAGYSTIVLGGYVSSIGAGLACPDWPTCRGQLVPPLTEPAVVAEYFHRLSAFVTGLLALGTLILVWLYHRKNLKLALTATVAFMLLTVQVLLGMITITTLLDPVVVTAHLGVATAFLATMTATTIVAFRSAGEVSPREAPSEPQREC
jgi:cytochrome c oxidase assembly protein subunit 15